MSHQKHLPLCRDHGHHSGFNFYRFCRSVFLRISLLLCIGLYSVIGLKTYPVIIHDHDESHTGHHVDAHLALDPHNDDDEDHHDGDEGEHHHHLSCSGNVAMASVTPSSHKFFQQVMTLSATSFDEVCPSGPVFELIKPPQAS